MSKKRSHLTLVDPDELERDMRKESLLIEASQYGYAIDLDLELNEIEDQVRWMREEREGKPPCFKRSFKATSPYCKICDLKTLCGIDFRQDPNFLLQDLDSELCEVCKAGYLQIELIDPETGQVRNYACSHMGCHNTALDQRRFQDERKLAERARKKAAEVKAAEEKKAPKDRRTTSRRRLNLEKQGAKAAAFFREQGGTLTQIRDLVGCLQVTYASAHKVLDFMLEAGMISKIIKPGDEDRKKPRYIYQLVMETKQHGQTNNPDDD